MHLVLHALLNARGDAHVTADVVVIGIGNSFRRDDGVGITVVDELARRRLTGVEVVASTGEPGALLEAWSGARLAVVVDAVGGEGRPGRVRRCKIDEVAGPAQLSSHATSLRQTYELGRALELLPNRLVVFTVDAADTGHGVGLTVAVAEAVPSVVAAVIREVSTAIRDGSAHQRTTIQEV